MTHDPAVPMTLWDRLAWVGTILIGLLCLARAMVEHDPFPWWASDPFVFAPPISGLTPRWALLLNAGLMCSASMTLLAHAKRGFGVTFFDGLLLTLGLSVIAFHTLIDIERALDASTISAVVCVFLAATKAHTLPGGLRVLGSAVLAFPIMLVCIGIYEVYVSHPETIKMYELSRDSFLAARGWSEGSFEALAYERRLRNPEPLAWFGLTNVFASFVAAGGAAMFTLAFARWKTERNSATLTAIGGMVCAFGVFLCASKGGYAVFAVGVLLGIVITIQPTRAINGKVILALCALTLLGLGLRGFIGEGLDERSLLFRSQYLAGSMNIWLEHPLLGSGPGMFQDHYARLKPSLSPEVVATPHSVWFAWLATLGFGGIGLVTLMIQTLGKSKLITVSAATEPSDAERTNWTKLALVLIVLPMLFALQMQNAVLTASELTPLLVGLVLWGLAAMYIVRSKVSDTQLRAAVFVLAGVLLIHSMIEVTGSLIVSAPLWALMLGLSVNTKSDAQSRGLMGLLTPLMIIASVGVALTQWPSINRWERGLHNAAHDASSIARIYGALNALEFSTTPEQDLDQIATMLGSMTGQSVSSSYDSIIPTLHQAELVTRIQSIELLEDSLAARQTHTPTRIAISQQMLWLASFNQSVGNDSQASTLWDQSSELFTGDDLTPQSHRWASSTWAGRTSAYPDAPNRDQWLQNAFKHAQLAFQGTPHDPKLAFRIMQLAIELDDSVAALTWGEQALDIHEQMRLDPLRGLNADEIRSVEAVISHSP